MVSRSGAPRTRGRGTRAHAPRRGSATKPREAAKPREEGRRWRVLLAGAALVAATLAAYAPLRTAGFIWDDDDYVTRSSVLRSGEGLRRIWSEPRATPQYYPLVHTSYWLEYRLWGLDPLGYHAVNVLLHGLSALLLWRVLARLELRAAWIAAAAFALHPVMMESVAWVTERKNVLSAFFFLAALLAFLRYRPLPAERQPPAGAAWYAASLALFAAALASKTVTVSLPAVLVLLAWWKEGRVERRVWLPLVPMFLLGFGAAFLTVQLEKHHVGAQGAPWDLSLAERVAIAGRALWFYAAKLVWPADLAFVYPRWRIDLADPLAWAAPVAFAAVLGLLWWRRQAWGRGPLVAVLAFAGVLVPALGFFDVYPMRFSFVADHFQYHAAPALLVLLVASGARPLARLPGRWPAAVGAALLLLLAGLTWQRAGVFTTAERLWRDTLAKNPDAWLAHNNLARLLIDRGELDAARHHLEAALRLEPGYPHAVHNLGVVAWRQGRFGEAATHFEAVLRENPRSVQAWTMVARWHLQEGRPARAEEGLRRALALAPEDPEAHLFLGDALLQLGRRQEAQAEYRSAAALDPRQVRAHFALGVLLRQEGAEAEAAAAFREGLRRAPGNVLLLERLSLLLATARTPEVRDGAAAVELARLALQVAGEQDAEAHHVLAVALAAAGRTGEAAAAAGRATELARRAGDARNGERYARSQRLFARGLRVP